MDEWVHGYMDAGMHEGITKARMQEFKNEIVSQNELMNS